MRRGSTSRSVSLGDAPSFFDDAIREDPSLQNDVGELARPECIVGIVEARLELDHPRGGIHRIVDEGQVAAHRARDGPGRQEKQIRQLRRRKNHRLWICFSGQNRGESYGRCDPQDLANRGTPQISVNTHSRPSCLSDAQMIAMTTARIASSRCRVIVHCHEDIAARP